MRIMTIKFSRLACCALAVAAMTLSASRASAVTLNIDPSLSTVNLAIELGGFPEGTEEDPTAGPFQAISAAVGQGVQFPHGTGVGEVNPYGPDFFNGLTARLGGTIDVTPGAFSIDGASINPFDSGDWQPDNTPDIGLALPGEFGVYLFADLVPVIGAGSLEAILRLNDSLFSVTTGAMALDGFGNFADPSANLELTTATAVGVAVVDTGGGPSNTPIPPTVLGPESATTGIAGNYSGGVLTLPFGTVLYVSLQDAIGLPFYLAITISGELVTVVPEPSSIAMACSAMVGVVAYGVYGRRRRR